MTILSWVVAGIIALCFLALAVTRKDPAPPAVVPSDDVPSGEHTPCCMHCGNALPSWYRQPHSIRRWRRRHARSDG